MKRFFPQLSRIAALVKFTSQCTRNEITGIADTEYKITACYLATKVTRIDHHSIARFFQIHPLYMQKRLQEYSIKLLLDPDLKEILNQMEEFVFDLDLANALK